MTLSWFQSFMSVPVAVARLEQLDDRVVRDGLGLTHHPIDQHPWAVQLAERAFGVEPDEVRVLQKSMKPATMSRTTP